MQRGVNYLFAFFLPTGWYEGSFWHFTYPGCTVHVVLQIFEHFSPFIFCISLQKSNCKTCSWLLGFCWDVFWFLVWENLPVTSCRNDGLLKAEVQPLHLQLSCNVPYCILRALQMFLKSFLERKGMLLLSKQDTVACVQNSFQLLIMSASWMSPRVSHLWSCPSPDAEGNCGG